MSEASVQNGWKEFKVSYALLTDATLHLSVGDGVPIAAPGLSEAVAHLLIVKLMDILDEAIKLQMTGEDYRACGILQNRLRWLNRDGLLENFDQLTEVRRRFEGDAPRSAWQRDPKSDLVAAYEAVEEQLAAWGLAVKGRRYTIRETVGYCKVWTADGAEMLSTSWTIERPRKDEVLASVIDVMDGTRIVSSIVERLPKALAKKIDPVKARINTYMRALDNRGYAEHRFTSLATYATQQGGVAPKAVEEARQQVKAIEAEMAVLDEIKDPGDAADQLMDMRQRFNVHLAIIRDAVKSLEALPVLAEPVGKAADQV